MIGAAHRVVVTGCGVVGPLGDDVERMFERLCRGESGIRALSGFDPAFCPSTIGGVVEGFDVSRHITDRAGLRSARLMEPQHQWALCAAQSALLDAGLDLDALMQADAPIDRQRLGVCLGTGLSGRAQFQDSARLLVRNLRGSMSRAMADGVGLDAWVEGDGEDALATVSRVLAQDINPVTLLRQLPSIGTAFIAMRFGAQGPNLTTVSLCAAGAQAIGEAAWMIARGDADAMLAGGADSMLNPIDLSAFARLDAVSARNEAVGGACRPFDLQRDGCVVGEGAAMLLLEREDLALQRGARILAILAGYGSSDDAWRISAPPEDGNGAIRAMTAALRSAGLKPEDIGHINAHGTGTLLNDRVETLAIKRTFDAHAARMPVVSTKSMTGHLIAAAGAIEAVISIQCLRQARIPPTINLQTPDPRCDLDYAADGTRAMPDLRAVLSNSFAIGGVNASLVFARADA